MKTAFRKREAFYFAGVNSFGEKTRLAEKTPILSSFTPNKNCWWYDYLFKDHRRGDPLL
jgi:hypothetical protein